MPPRRGEPKAWTRSRAAHPRPYGRTSSYSAPRFDRSAIPIKALDRNVLMGTWNIRGFGKVLENWGSAPDDSPKRNLRDVLAEIISRFDVVALQEVKRDLGGLRRLMEALGPNWAWILTDFTRWGGRQLGADGVRVRPGPRAHLGLAAELVVPIEARRDDGRLMFQGRVTGVHAERSRSRCIGVRRVHLRRRHKCTFR